MTEGCVRNRTDIGARGMGIVLVVIRHTTLHGKQHARLRTRCLYLFYLGTRNLLVPQKLDTAQIKR